MPQGANGLFQTDGSAAFAGNVQVGGNTQAAEGVLFQSNGGVYSYRSSSQTTSAVFSGGSIGNRNTCDIFANGRAVFAGDVTANSFNSLGATYLSYFGNGGGVGSVTGLTQAIYKSTNAIHYYVKDTGEVGIGNSNDSATGVPNLTLKTDGGIQFPTGSSTGKTVTSNTLDDYEEGTWAPTYTSGVTNPNYDAGTSADYTKIGNVVNFVIRINCNGGTANSDHLKIGPLPFLSSSSVRNGGGYFIYMGGLPLTSGNDPTVLISQNSSTLQFYHPTGNNWLGTDGNGALNKVLHIVGQYMTDL